MSITTEKQKEKRDKRKERKRVRGEGGKREEAGTRKTKAEQIQYIKSSLPTEPVSLGSCPTGLGVRRPHSDSQLYRSLL